MPSLQPGFEYDVFISYRHNDNRSGWVTEFVRSLKEELATIIKDPVSVYFDSNPYDGLLETHNVDKSLEGKLKALVFVPILSQIYCDPKSFAWQHEFCAYNRFSAGDGIGRDVMLRNGNVANRILPVIIHDLESEDLSLIETELNYKLRHVDFTFRSSGVNRPLRKEDSRQENKQGLVYHDQINKMAHAIKEIIGAIRQPGRSSEPLASPMDPESGNVMKEGRGDTPKPEKSLAVLPFTNLSQDPSQEYFADGITENILIQLAGLPQFRVISRTSVMRYKKTTKSAPEIATELGVKYILEGSAQAHQGKVRIAVQLIDAALDKNVWAKVFMESLDDLFAIQSSVAAVVASELKASFNPGQQEKLTSAPTKNREAYDLFLKGRHAFNQWSVDGYRIATDYFKKALALDPEFKEAYSYLASSYSARMSWNGDLSPDEAMRNIQVYLGEAWQRGPSDNDYLIKAYVEFFISKDFAAAEALLKSAMGLNPNNANVLYAYCYLYNMMGRFEAAAGMVSRVHTIDPLTVGYFNYQILTLYLMDQYEEALASLREAIQLYPTVLRLYDFLGRTYLTMGRYAEAVDAIETGLRTAKIRPPSMVAYLAAAYAGKQDRRKADELTEELIQRSEGGEKGVNIYLVHAFLGLGNGMEARKWLEKSRKTNDVDLIWWDVDPLLKSLRESSTDSPDFEGAECEIMAMLEDKMPKLPYHNLQHILEVLKAVVEIARNEGTTEEELKLLRLAALLHDVGFIESPRNHEERGADIARQVLKMRNFNSGQIDIICNMILATRVPQSPVTRLEKIICDADLDYLGREDFYDVGGRLYTELLSQGAVDTEREWNLVQKTFLEAHRFHTAFSKSAREGAKNQRLQEIAARLEARA